MATKAHETVLASDSIAPKSGRASEVFILGAGFSRAVAPELPLTDELGESAIQRDPSHLGRSNGKLLFARGTFESWLSRRAEDQPYLTAAQNLANRAVFARGTTLIAGILDERVSSALSRPMPSWLGELVSYWHLRKSNVITFNYDPLIECAFQSMNFWDWRAKSFFQWGSLINYSPTGKAGHSYGEADGTSAPHASFRIWKMHGSLNWHWVAGDATGATALRSRLPGLFGAPDPVTTEDLHWVAPGRDRLIVPPAALKSGYYNNPVIREIWGRAFDALRTATHVTLMGYSVPSTDLSTSGMLAESLLREHSPIVEVVDYAPEPVADRLRGLGDFPLLIDSIGRGETAVVDYVRSLMKRAGKEALGDLLHLEEDDATPIYVTWGDVDTTQQVTGRSAAVIGLRAVDKQGNLDLLTEPLGTELNAIRARNATPENGPLEPFPITFGMLRQVVRPGSLLRLLVPGIERSVTVIGATRARFEIGHGKGSWIQLVPAGGPN